MPAVSIQQADLTYLTAEDPRTESLDAILQDMANRLWKPAGARAKTFGACPTAATPFALRFKQPVRVTW